MKNSPNESDWKQFRAIASDLKERYLRRKNGESAAVFTDEKSS
jgi:hypothetical protein